MTPLEELNAAMQKSGPDNWVRHSTADEIEKLAPSELTIPNQPITAIIDDWSFITIADRGTVKMHIVGNVVGTTKTRVTSPLIVADRRTWQVLTATGSVYDLGTAHSGDLDMQQTYALAKIIQAWRISTSTQALALLEWFNLEPDALH